MSTLALASAGLSWQTEGKRQLTEAAHSAQLSVHTGATPGTYWWPQAGCPGGGVFKLHFAIGSYLRSVLFFFFKKTKPKTFSQARSVEVEDVLAPAVALGSWRGAQGSGRHTSLGSSFCGTGNGAGAPFPQSKKAVGKGCPSWPSSPHV